MEALFFCRLTFKCILAPCTVVIPLMMKFSLKNGLENWRRLLDHRIRLFLFFNNWLKLCLKKQTVVKSSRNKKIQKERSKNWAGAKINVFNNPVWGLITVNKIKETQIAMNFSKSLSIYDTHANSLFIGQLTDSGERPLSELDTVRGLEPYISKI